MRPMESSKSISPPSRTSNRAKMNLFCDLHQENHTLSEIQLINRTPYSIFCCLHGCIYNYFFRVPKTLISSEKNSTESGSESAATNPTHSLVCCQHSEFGKCPYKIHLNRCIKFLKLNSEIILASHVYRPNVLSDQFFSRDKNEMGKNFVPRISSILSKQKLSPRLKFLFSSNHHFKNCRICLSILRGKGSSIHKSQKYNRHRGGYHYMICFCKREHSRKIAMKLIGYGLSGCCKCSLLIRPKFSENQLLPRCLVQRRCCSCLEQCPLYFPEKNIAATSDKVMTEGDSSSSWNFGPPAIDYPFFPEDLAQNQNFGQTAV